MSSKKIIKTACLAGLLTLGLAACKKTEDPVLHELPADGSFKVYTDTFELRTANRLRHGVSGQQLTYDILGAMISSPLGPISASIYTEVGLPDKTPELSGSPAADSLVLKIKIRYDLGYLGNLSSPVVLDVFRLTKPLPAKPANTLSIDTTFETTPLVSALARRTKDSCIVIALPLAQAQEILARPDAFSGQDVWNDYFGGLHIAAQGAFIGQGFMYVADMVSPASNMTLYYRTGTGDAKSIQFSFGRGAMRVNHRKALAIRPAISSQFALDSAGQWGSSYISNIMGLQIRVTAPGLERLVKEGHIGVIRAKFDFYNVTPDNPDDAIRAPSMTLLRPAGEDGKDNLTNFIDDLQPYYDGTLQNGGYTFYLTKYMQAVMNQYREHPDFKWLGLNLSAVMDKPDYGARIVDIASKEAANPTKRPRLIITYTKLD